MQSGSWFMKNDLLDRIILLIELNKKILEKDKEALCSYVDNYKKSLEDEENKKGFWKKFIDGFEPVGHNIFLDNIYNKLNYKVAFSSSTIRDLNKFKDLCVASTSDTIFVSVNDIHLFSFNMKEVDRLLSLRKNNKTND